MKSKLPVQSKSRAILTNDVKYEIDSRRLLYFYHVAKYGSFSKAEAVLGVAQPAISRQINLLEKELDAELLIRHGRGVSMTAIGGILYKQAGVIFTEMELTVRMIDVEKKSPTGILSLAASAVAISVFMPDVVFSFMDNHPEISSYQNFLEHILSNEEKDYKLIMNICTSGFSWLPVEFKYGFKAGVLN